MAGLLHRWTHRMPAHGHTQFLQLTAKTVQLQTVRLRQYLPKLGMQRARLGNTQQSVEEQMYFSVLLEYPYRFHRIILNLQVQAPTGPTRLAYKQLLSQVTSLPR